MPIGYCEPPNTPPEPQPIAECRRCGSEIYAGIDCTIPATWEDERKRLVCEDCVTEEETNYLLKVG
ncbi:MAG: hypothetical protein JM58_09625 [Peptococcaceae bacterium BICA1-8]|nr:MAG: hypothetical protein JM58_09625 [Peptococcaceae bacterium BICA1-8]